MDERKITQALLLKKLITESDLENLEQNDDEKITKALIDEGSISQEAIALVTSDELDIPFLHVIPELIDWERWEEYASSLFLIHNCVPIFQEAEVVIVMTYPLSVEDQHEIKQIFKDIPLSFAMGTDESISRILKVYDENIARVKKTRRTRVRQQESLSLNSQIVISEAFHEYLFVVSRHIKEAMSNSATQLHIRISTKFLKVYSRVDNQLNLVDSYAYDEEWKTCIKLLQEQQPGKTSFEFFFQVETDFFSAYTLFGHNSLIVINLKQKQNIYIDEEIVEEILQPFHGLVLLVSPRFEDIKTFAYALMRKSIQQKKITCSVEHKKQENINGVFQVDNNENGFITHLKPDILYTETPLSYYHHLSETLVFQAVVASTTTDAFFNIINDLPQSYVATALRYITIVAKVRNEEHKKIEHRFIVEHIKIDKSVRKLAWDQPKYQKAETIIPQTTIVKTLSEMLKNKQAHIDDLSLFL
ncbi:hypothetical protein [Candidatus Uabimicrobium amorphum]|uniref:Pilus biosynthesis protein PilB n=1 Tax=Uabimicrobium amorphum TaxID=2596890 RepID=A0A5S9F519_UABAM|nr:hypothetical protein [Candidatus Uabimicrobium amorphum]BBM85084.1 pilus biosynthesis protein PilB [Candidatus Uabimicrobium amorphum]